MAPKVFCECSMDFVELIYAGESDPLRDGAIDVAYTCPRCSSVHYRLKRKHETWQEFERRISGSFNDHEGYV